MSRSSTAATFSNIFSVASSAAAPLTLGGDIVFDTTIGGSVTGTIVLVERDDARFLGRQRQLSIGGTIDGTTAGAQAFTFDEPQRPAPRSARRWVARPRSAP